ncbi:hypothetical protein GN956_G24499 [Arapaima gigas]
MYVMEGLTTFVTWSVFRYSHVFRGNVTNGATPKPTVPHTAESGAGIALRRRVVRCLHGDGTPSCTLGNTRLEKEATSF